MDSDVEMAVQVNGKLKGTVTVAMDSDEETVKAAALALDKVQKATGDMTVVKTILVKNKLHQPHRQARQVKTQKHRLPRREAALFLPEKIPLSPGNVVFYMILHKYVLNLCVRSTKIDVPSCIQSEEVLISMYIQCAPNRPWAVIISMK